ncbi:MAG: hypothetical protein ACI831_001115 [Candidatus Azotimanducaceae bacterium]|jgi:hypothetical protein
MNFSLSRRQWLRSFALSIGAIAVLPQRALSKIVLMSTLLESAEFAYISPKLSNGDESSCHGEVWFAWIDNRIVIVTARSSWKCRALASGLDSAYIWVGSYGRWKGWFGRRNLSFQDSARLVGRASESRDPELLGRMLDVFAVKYPDEFPDWEQEQRDGFHDNRRTLIVYELIDATQLTISAASSIPSPS